MGLEDYVIARGMVHVLACKGLVDIASVGIGLAKGYMNAKGIDINPYLSKTLIAAPFLAHIGMGVVAGGLYGAMDADRTNNPREPFFSKAIGLSSIIAATELGLGYTVGYTLGSYFS